MGLVLKVEERFFEAYLRKQSSEDLTYIFPEKEDKFWIYTEKIIKKLSEPEVITDGSGARLIHRFKSKFVTSNKSYESQTYLK